MPHIHTKYGNCLHFAGKKVPHPAPLPPTAFSPVQNPKCCPNSSPNAGCFFFCSVFSDFLLWQLDAKGQLPSNWWFGFVVWWSPSPLASSSSRWQEDSLGLDYVGATMTTDPAKSCMRDKAMSKFSPWLAHGCLSPRFLYEEARERIHTIHIYIYMHTHVYMHICIYIYIQTHALLNVCLYIYIYIYMCVCVYVCI